MFLRLGPKSRSVPLVSLIPNVLTTLAVCCGLASVHYALLANWKFALAAIILAAIFDVLDGGAARLLRVQSSFGAVLDSLSDFLAFGVAPAIIMHQWILQPVTSRTVDTLGLLSVMIFALCAALRLARFTATINLPTPTTAVAATVAASPPVDSDATSSHAVPAPTPPPATQTKRPSMFFTGMPTPAGAGVALVPACLAASKDVDYFSWHVPEWAIAIYLITVGLLMVSTVPMFAIKGLRISRRLVAPLLIIVIAIATMMLTNPFLTIAGISMLYIASIPVAIIVRRSQRKRENM